MSDNSNHLSRRLALKAGAAAGAAIALSRIDAFAAGVPASVPQPRRGLTTRMIPSSRERVPVVGIGTSLAR